MLKARHFDTYNAARLQRVRASFLNVGDAKSPEHRSLLPYFLSHPEADRFIAPSMGLVGKDITDENGNRVTVDTPYWEATVDRDEDPNARTHACILGFALTEISSVPFLVHLIAHEWGDQITARDVGRMKSVFDELREAGLWVDA
jgi:hypothetical protein